jgi:hypothetical protein
MINKKQLNSIGYYPLPGDKTMFVVLGSWEYGYCIAKQELWHLNDGIGKAELEGKITDFEVLKGFLELKGEIYPQNINK